MKIVFKNLRSCKYLDFSLFEKKSKTNVIKKKPVFAYKGIEILLEYRKKLDFRIQRHFDI